MEPIERGCNNYHNYNSTLNELREQMAKAAGIPSNYLYRDGWAGEVALDAKDVYRDLKNMYSKNHWKVEDIEFEVEKPKRLKAKRNKGGIRLETE